MDGTPLQADDPRRLGGYRIIGRLGRGGYGVVYLAEGPSGRVAVKLLQTALTRVERERFGREAQAAKQVARFCTAQVLDADTDGDRPYIVSEYVPGPAVSELVRARGPLTGGQLDRLAIGMATALVAIHQAHIVHRDFKPANVLMGPDGPRVIDFGIARMLDAAATVTSHTLGTPAYMAPEQVSGGELTPAVDVFAWGATVAYAANGIPPFGRDTIPVLVQRILYQPPDLGTLTGPLRDLVAQCLAKDPHRRPTASTLLMRLLGHETGDQTAILAEGRTAAVPTTCLDPHPPTVRPAAHQTPAAAWAAANLDPQTVRPETLPQTWQATLASGTRPTGRKRRYGVLVGALVLALMGGGGATALALQHPGSGKPQAARMAGNPQETASSGSQSSGYQRHTGSNSGTHTSTHSSEPVEPPRLNVSADCALGSTGTTCTITLSATGSIDWTAEAADPLSLGSTSGHLGEGESGTITVTLSTGTPRAAGTGTVTITGGGRTHSVTVTWAGADSPAATPTTTAGTG